LEVEFVRIDRTSEAMPALAQGQIDVAAGFFDISTLNAVAKGGDIKYVSDKGYLDPDTCSAATWVARKDLLEDGTLDDLNNLAGMNVAITPTSSGEYFLDLLLGKVNLSTDDVAIQNIPLPARMDGLKNKTIELAGVADPWTVRMVNADLGEVWEPWESYIPDFQFSLIMYGPNLLQENPEVGERFMMAYIKSVRQYNEGKTDRNVEIIANYTQMDPAEVTQACWMAMKSDGRLTMIGMDEFQEWAVSKGYIDDAIPSDQLVDNRFVEKANQVLGEP
jgi:NitT/TauT family transport system substrate-binding protein